MIYDTVSWVCLCDHWGHISRAQLWCILNRCEAWPGDKRAAWEWMYGWLTPWWSTCSASWLKYCYTRFNLGQVLEGLGTYYSEINDTVTVPGIIECGKVGDLLDIHGGNWLLASRLPIIAHTSDSPSSPTRQARGGGTGGGWHTGISPCCHLWSQTNLLSGLGQHHVIHVDMSRPLS